MDRCDSEELKQCWYQFCTVCCWILRRLGYIVLMISLVSLITIVVVWDNSSVASGDADNTDVWQPIRWKTKWTPVPLKAMACRASTDDPKKTILVPITFRSIWRGSGSMFDIMSNMITNLTIVGQPGEMVDITAAHRLSTTSKGFQLQDNMVRKAEMSLHLNKNNNSFSSDWEKLVDRTNSYMKIVRILLFCLLGIEFLVRGFLFFEKMWKDRNSATPTPWHEIDVQEEINELKASHAAYDLCNEKGADYQRFKWLRILRLLGPLIFCFCLSLVAAEENAWKKQWDKIQIHGIPEYVFGYSGGKVSLGKETSDPRCSITSYATPVKRPGVLHPAPCTPGFVYPYQQTLDTMCKTKCKTCKTKMIGNNFSWKGEYDYRTDLYHTTFIIAMVMAICNGLIFSFESFSFLWTYYWPRWCCFQPRNEQSQNIESDNEQPESAALSTTPKQRQSRHAYTKLRVL